MFTPYIPHTKLTATQVPLQQGHVFISTNGLTVFSLTHRHSFSDVCIQAWRVDPETATIAIRVPNMYAPLFKIVFYCGCYLACIILAAMKGLDQVILVGNL